MTSSHVFGTRTGNQIMFNKFDFYSESEYVFDFKTRENDFFYVYSEMALRPIQTIRTGMVVQRTKLFETERELERGIFGEYYFKNFRGDSSTLARSVLINFGSLPSVWVFKISIE